MERRVRSAEMIYFRYSVIRPDVDGNQPKVINDCKYKYAVTLIYTESCTYQIAGHIAVMSTRFVIITQFVIKKYKYSNQHYPVICLKYSTYMSYNKKDTINQFF